MQEISVSAADEVTDQISEYLDTVARTCKNNFKNLSSMDSKIFEQEAKILQFVEEKVKKHPEIKDWSLSFKKRLKFEFLGLKQELICIFLKKSYGQVDKAKDLNKEFNTVSTADPNRRKAFVAKLLETKTELEGICQLLQCLIDHDLV